MSQAIRKYQTGGKSSQEPELFEWKDVNKYNKSDLVSGLYRNIDTYIQNNGLKGDKADQFRKAAGQFIEGLKSGTVTMNGDGTFTDASGQMSSTGKYDKKFLGLGTKNTENNAFNRVGDYALSYIKGMSPYKAQVEEKPQTKAAPISFKQRLANIAMGGNWDDSLWRKFNSQDRLGFLRQAIQSSHNDFINNPEAEYNKDVFGTRENWIERSSNLLKALEDNKYDPEDLKFSAAMGYGDLGTYLNDEVSKGGNDVNLIDAYRKSLIADAKSKGILGDEAINAYVEKGLRDQANKEKEIINTNKAELKTEATKKYFEDYRKNNPFKSSMSGHFGNVNPNYNIDNLLDYLKGQPDMANYFTNVLGRTSFRPDNGQHIVNNMNAALSVMRSQFPDIGDGFVAVPTTYDFNNYTSIAYNPETKQYKEVSMLDIPALQQIAYAHYENPTDSSKPRVAPRVPKRGGSYFQQGGSIGFNREAANAEILKAIRERDAKRQADKEAKVEQSVASGKSPQQAVSDSRKPADTGFTASDYARLGAIGADLISMIPGAGVVGYAGTLANFGADWGQDGLDWGDAGRLAMNLGLDTVGLIPGLGAAAKGSKVVKNLIKWTPRLLSAAAAINYTGPGIESARKLATNPKDLSVDDYRNLAELIKVVVGGGKGVKRQIQSKQLRNAAATGNHVITSATGKEYTVTGAQLDEIASHGKLKDQQAAFQKITKSDDRLGRQVNFSWHNPFITSLPNSVVRPEYNFNKTKIVSTTKGDIEVPLVYSNSEKGIVKRMQTGVISIPGLDKPAQWYNSFKYRNLNKGQAKPSELLALPAPNQVTPSNRVFHMGDSKSRQVVDITDPNKLAQTRATGDRNRRNEAIRNERLNKQAEAREAQKARNEALTAWATNQPSPKQPLAGAARANKERTYREVFQPVAEREYNKVWDEAVINRKDFGYEDMTPRRNIYAPPTPTEIFVTPSAPIKDKNARYLWELVNPPKRSTAHVKRELPEKQSKPKTKKKSKDDRVTKKTNGGVLIPKYQGGKAIRNVQSANNLNWNTDVLGSAGYNDTLGMINPANASTYNNMQRDYSNLGFTATKPGASRLSYNQNVANYQTNFNTNTKVNTGTMAGLVKSGRITGRGGSSDKDTQWTADGYAGDQTWLRHLGTNNISADNLAKVRAGVNDNIDVIKNLNTGMLNFMPKAKAAGITSGNPQPAMPTKLESPVPAMGSNPTKKQIRDAKRSQKAAGDGTVRGAAGGEKEGLGGFSVLPEDVIALGRMVGGLATNNKAAEQYKAGLKPLLIDTYENTVPITGNYFAKASADRQASNLTSLAARPRTSDASLQLAGELEAQNKAGDIRFQGDMADADMFYKTRMMAQQESDAAKARRTDVANRNRASMLQIDAAKAQIDSAKTTANYQQVINPYLSGIENQFRQNRAARKQYDAESYRQGLLSTMQPQYDAAVQAGDTAKQQQLLRQYNTDMLNYSRNNVGMPWMFQRTTPSPNTPYTYAKGGRLTAQERIIIQRAKDFNRRMLADNKQFHKDIMAAKKQHADMIKHMSSLTSELIKKGMSWK